MNAIQFFTNKNCTEIDDPMAVGHKPLGTDLFELQMGLIEIGNGQAVWGGSLQNVNNGEKRYFKGWSGLVANLRELLTPFSQLEVLEALLQTKEVMYWRQNRSTSCSTFFQSGNRAENPSGNPFSDDYMTACGYSGA
jgi:hypothetical protein